MKKEEYLDRLTEQIRCGKAREPVRREINQHIEEQIKDYMAKGMTEEDAAEAAVQDMGDPEEAGIALDKIHRPQMAWGMIVLIGMLGVAGTVVSGAVMLRQEGATGYAQTLVIRQGMYLVLSFAVMTAVCYMDYSRIARRAREIYLVLAGSLCILLPHYGLGINGSIRWIGIGPVTINVLVFAFLLVPLYGAILYTYKGQGYRALVKSILWMIPGLWAALIAPAHSISTLGILFLAYTVLLSVAISKNWFCVSRRKTLGALWGAVLLLPAAAGFYLLKFTQGYQAGRIQALLHPAQGEGGYVLRMIRGLLYNSRLVGAGQEALSGEIEYFSEYALTYLIAYYGILAGALLVALAAGLFWRFLRISLKQKNQLGMIMGIGCSVVLMLQLVLFLISNLGVGAATGAPCPFFTYGGGEKLSSFMMFGLLLSIYRYEKVLTGA